MEVRHNVGQISLHLLLSTNIFLCLALIVLWRPVKRSTPASAIGEKVEGEWLVDNRSRGKIYTAEPRSPVSSTAKKANSPVFKINRE